MQLRLFKIVLNPLFRGIFSYSKQFFSYAIIGLIDGNPMNAYLRTDSYTATKS